MQARTIFLVLLLFAAGLGIGYYAGHHSAVSHTSAAKNILGPWKAKFTVPGSADLAEQNTVIRCRFAKPLEYDLGFMNITLTNLDDRQFLVRYAVFGYDKKGQRISEGTDQFAIGRHKA